jgi:hypothetical protein
MRVHFLQKNEKIFQTLKHRLQVSMLFMITIFDDIRRKKCVFLKNQCYDQIFAQLSLVQNAIFSQYFWRKYFLFLYGPPRVPRCRRSLGKFWPLR